MNCLFVFLLLWWQQAEKVSPDFSVPGHSFQVLMIEPDISKPAVRDNLASRPWVCLKVSIHCSMPELIVIIDLTAFII